MKILFTPEEKYVAQIKAWLHQEMLDKRSYFYYNFINAKFTEENFACYVDENDEAIGYMYFTHNERFTHIDVAVVKFAYQRKGIGRMLLDAVSELSRKQGSVALSLSCVPKSSSRRWIKLGFKKFKEVANHGFLKENAADMPWLYKVIVPAKKATRKKAIAHYISIWCDEPHRVEDSDIPANYTWDLTSSETPIVYPVDGDWRVKYVREDVVVYDEKIKRFRFNECESCAFLVVENLNKLS